MFGIQFWFFNLVAPIIIVEDLHPSYILNKKRNNTKQLLCLSLFTDEHKPSFSLFTPWPTQIFEEAGGQRCNSVSPRPSLSLFTPLADANRGGRRPTTQLRLYRERNPHYYWARNNPHCTRTTPIILYFKVYALMLFSFQDLTMLSLFRSCFNFLFLF